MGMVALYRPGREPEFVESMFEGPLVDGANEFGVRSADALAHLVSLGRTEQATRCMEAVRETVLSPPVSGRLARAGVVVGAMALRARDRLRRDLSGRKARSRDMDGAGSEPPGP